MTVKILREQEVIQEAVTILLANMQPSKVARCLSAWQVGTGNYLAIKEQLFAGETVATLFEKIQIAQKPSEEA
ncbi:MAG: hypothetical protein LDL41_16650 [Coleofasciculus sp. S288]|nr:hypothetical protein [Coleofasciculus sp. S288]